MTQRRIKKVAKKLYKINQKEEIIVALSKKLESNEELKNEINRYNIKILNR